MSGRYKTRKNNTNKGLPQGALTLRVPTEQEVKSYTDIFEKRLKGYVNDADREVLEKRNFINMYHRVFGYDRKTEQEIVEDFYLPNGELRSYISAENERYPFQSKEIKFSNWTYKMKERNPDVPKESLYMENPQFKYAWEMFLNEEKAKQEENVRKHNEMLLALRQAEEARDEAGIREIRKKLFEKSASSWLPPLLGKGGRKYYKIHQTTPRRYKSRRANGSTPRKNKRKRGSKRR